MPSDTSSTPAKATNQPENVATFRATSYRSLLPSPVVVLSVLVLAVAFNLIYQLWFTTASPASAVSPFATAIGNGWLFTVIVILAQMTNRFPSIEISSRGLVRRGIFQSQPIVTWGSISLITKTQPAQLQILTIYDQVITINNGDFGLPLSKIEEEIARYRLAGEKQSPLETDVVSREWLSNGIVTVAVATIVACAAGSTAYAVASRFMPSVQPWLAAGALGATVLLGGVVLALRGLFTTPSFKMDANEIAILRFRAAPVVVPWEQISKIRVRKADNHRAIGLELQTKNSESLVVLPWTIENSRFMLKLIARAKGRSIQVEE